MKKKNKKIITTLLISLLILVIGVSSLVGMTIYNLVLNSNYPKDIVYADYDMNNIKEEDKWLKEKSNYKDTYIESLDNLKLHAYTVTHNKYTDKYAVVVHGYGGNGELMSAKAKYFYDMGYNVIIPDLRGHGKSDGEYIGMGYKDRLDIISWINYIIKSNKNSQIVLHGTSMGAATVLMTSGEKLPSNVKAIIADCSYTSAWDEFKYQLETYLNIPSSYILNITNIATKLKAHYSLKDVSPIDAVKKAQVPILYIHGDQDRFVPYFMMNKLYENTNSPKEKLVVEGAEHANSNLVAPYLYWLTVEDFLEKYINYKNKMAMIINHSHFLYKLNISLYCSSVFF